MRDGGSGKDSIAALLQAIEATPIAVALQDGDLKYRRLYNAGIVGDLGRVAGLSDVDILPAEAAAALTPVKQLVLQTGNPARLELPVAREDGVRHYDVYLSPDRANDGSIVGVVSVLIEVTPFRRSAQTMHLLLRELSHRSKNLLAIVQSLAAQTARTATTTEGFIQRFNGRIQSVSRSQDLITDADWRGARIRDLLSIQVDPYAIDVAQQLRFSGRDYYLRPNAALYVGLAMHELAVNAAQFGAFSVAEGRVAIHAERLDGGAELAEKGMLMISWEEEAAPPRPENEDQTEFGHALLARLVPASVGGRARRTFREGGLRYDLTLAEDEFE